MLILIQTIIIGIQLHKRDLFEYFVLNNNIILLCAYNIAVLNKYMNTFLFICVCLRFCGFILVILLYSHFNKQVK